MSSVNAVSHILSCHPFNVSHKHTDISSVHHIVHTVMSSVHGVVYTVTSYVHHIVHTVMSSVYGVVYTVISPVHHFAHTVMSSVHHVVYTVTSYVHAVIPSLQCAVILPTGRAPGEPCVTISVSSGQCVSLENKKEPIMQTDEVKYYRGAWHKKRIRDTHNATGHWNSTEVDVTS